jgi:hypothetical protein
MTLHATAGQTSFDFVPVRFFAFGGQGQDPVRRVVRKKRSGPKLFLQNGLGLAKQVGF